MSLIRILRDCWWPVYGFMTGPHVPEVGREQRGQRLPRVRDRVALEKVVFAAVPVARAHGSDAKEEKG